MHDLSHIKRMWRAAKKLSRKHEADEEILIQADTSTEKEEIIWIPSQRDYQERILKVAAESHMKEQPKALKAKFYTTHI